MTDLPAPSDADVRVPVPAGAQEPGYPTLREVGGRLRLLALVSAAGLLGLELRGCPPAGSSGAAPATDWLPWDPAPERIAGAR